MATKDKTTPKLNSTSPKKGDVAVAINQDLVLTFNEAIQLGSGNLIISNGDGDTRIITASSSTSSSEINVSGSKITLNLTKDLLPDSHYTVKIDNTAIQDLNGNAYAGIKDTKTFYFDTVDTLAPRLIKSTPSDNAANIASNANIVLTFNEKIQAGTGNITLISGSDSRTIAITDKQFKISGNTLIFNPDIDFNTGSIYQLHIAAGAIKDFTPEANATKLAIDVGFSTKTTGDKQAPLLQNYTGKGAIATPLQLIFQEGVKIGKGSFTLVNTADSNDKLIIPVTDASQVLSANNVLTIHPIKNLKPETTYALTAPKGIVTDLAKNVFAGLTTKAPFTFDTHDTTAPTITITSDKTAITNSAILYTFSPSEAIKNFTVDAISVTGGTKGEFKAIADTNNYTLLITPNANSTTPITVTIAEGAYTDLVGNTNLLPATASQAVDTVSPSVLITNDNNALTNTPILYTFTLSSASNDFSVEDITVTGGTKGEFKTLSPTSYTLTITPSSKSTTPITVVVAAHAFTDLAGNENLAAQQNSQAVDTVPPLLLGTTPVNDSLSVPRASNITLIFSENIFAGKGNFIISNGNDTQTISVEDNKQVVINTKILTINPAKDLVANSDYSVTFESGVVLDQVGNSFAGLTLPSQLNFKTASINTTTTKDSAGQSQNFVERNNAKALDGYLKNATVFSDTNGDGIQNAGEATTITDDYGNFELTNSKGTIIVSGGTDLSTGKPFAGTLRAPEGSKVVSPLTTLQQGFVEAGQTTAEAEKSVAKAFGFESAKINLMTYDPIAEIIKSAEFPATQATATQIMASSAQIANFIVTAGKVLQGAAGENGNLSTQTTSEALVKALVSAIAQDVKTDDGRINLADQTLLKTVIVEGAKEANVIAQKVAQAEGSTAPKFDAAVFTDKIDKMADTVVDILKNSANNITTVVQNNATAAPLTLLTNIDKISTFVQNDAGAALQQTAVTLDTKNTIALTTTLQNQVDLFTGTAAKQSIDKTDVNTTKVVPAAIENTPTPVTPTPDLSSGGGTSTGGGSTSGGGNSTSGGSTSGGSTSTSGGSTSGGSTSTGGGSTSGGGTSTGGSSTSGGNTSTGSSSTSGGGTSTGGSSTSGGGTSTGGSSTSGGGTVSYITGKSIDGYLKGATVFIDTNGDGVQNGSEPSITTDAVGNFTIPSATGRLIVSGGTDLSTGQLFKGVLKAPQGSNVITPLTTMQQGFVDIGKTSEQAKQLMAQAFGLDSTVDLTNYDPIASIVNSDATSMSVATKMMSTSAQIANFLVTAGQVLQGAGALSPQQVGDALIKSLATKATQLATQSNSNNLDLTDITTLSDVLTESAKVGDTAFQQKIDAAKSVVSAVLATAANSIKAAIASGGDPATLLTNIDKVSAFAQNDAGPALKSSLINRGSDLSTVLNAYSGSEAMTKIQAKVVNTQNSIAAMSAKDANAGLNIDVSSAGNINAGDQKIKFNFLSGNYTYSIANYSADDSLIFPMGQTITVKNEDLTDKKVELHWASKGNEMTVVLTGLTADQDKALLFASDVANVSYATSVPNEIHTPSSINVNAQGNTNASTGDIAFKILTGNYPYSIANFSKGDALNFPSAPSVSNEDFTDGIVNLHWGKDGQEVVITLTGLTNDQDKALLFNESFNSLFGANTLTFIQ